METPRAETVFLQHYDRLARIAYLVAPALPGRQSRLVRAHRLVHRALPWRARTALTYPQMVARVLRRAARPHRVGLPVLVTWAWHTPVSGGPDHRRLDAALAAAEPGARAGYTLTMVEHLAARDAVLLLQEAGWADAVARVAAASALRQRIHDEYGIRPDRQRELLAAPPADPTLIRLRAPDPLMIRLRRGVRLGAVALLTLLAGALVAGVLAGLPGGSSGGSPAGSPGGRETAGDAPLRVRRVAPAAWTRATELTLASWPTRGGRAGDDVLLRAALTAWHGALTVAPQATPGEGAVAVAVPTDAGPVRVTAEADAAADPPVAAPHLLYAGDLDGGAVAVLADAGRIATYAEAGGERTLRIQPAPRPDAYVASAIRLGTRFLLAPWVTGAETGDLGGGWKRLAATGGVTSPVPEPAGGDCWSGPLLRLRAADVAGGRPFTLADLGTTALAHLMSVPPEPAAMARPSELDTAGALATWADLGCAAGAVRDTAAESVTAWELWHGTLPRSTGTARVACVRAALPGAGNRVWAVATAPGTSPETVAEVAGTRLCSRFARDVVVGWWWQTPLGDWYHVATGSRQVRGIEVTVAGRTRRGDRLVVSGPYDDKPDGPVAIRATGRDARPVPVLQ